MLLRRVPPRCAAGSTSRTDAIMRRPFECHVALVLLRRNCCSCDGVAAATELRSSIYDALTLRVASERCDAQNDETSMQFPPRRFEIQRVVAHAGATVLLANIMPPPCPVIYPEVLLVTWCGLLPSCIYDLIYLQLVANNLSQRYKLTS